MVKHIHTHHACIEYQCKYSRVECNNARDAEFWNRGKKMEDVHLIFNLRTVAVICNLNMQGFRCHSLHSVIPACKF